MAIFFNEGLPGSGKSYDALVTWIIPALQKGRPVDAYIEGLNFERIAECAGIGVEDVEELLTQITRDQVETIWLRTRPNTLIVIDEAQNFWPTGRQRLGKEVTQFVTEHRHLGQDIVLMGQDLRDVHPIWRRRVQQKAVFTKLLSLGAGNRYSVMLYTSPSADKWVKSTAKTGKYDPFYFGTYASHVSTDTNTADHVDQRTQLFKQTAFRFGIPAFLILAVFAVWYLWRFFHPDDQAQLAKPGQAAAAPARPASAPKGPPGPRLAASAPGAPKVTGLAARFNGKYRPRIDTLFYTSTGWVGVIAWYDGLMVKERLSLQQIQDAGETVHIMSHQVELGGRSFAMGDLVRIGEEWITRWPLETQARVAGMATEIPRAAAGAP